MLSVAAAGLFRGPALVFREKFLFARLRFEAPEEIVETAYDFRRRNQSVDLGIGIIQPLRKDFIRSQGDLDGGNVRKAFCQGTICIPIRASRNRDFPLPGKEPEENLLERPVVNGEDFPFFTSSG